MGSHGWLWGVSSRGGPQSGRLCPQSDLLHLEYSYTVVLLLLLKYNIWVLLPPLQVYLPVLCRGLFSLFLVDVCIFKCVTYWTSLPKVCLNVRSLHGYKSACLSCFFFQTWLDTTWQDMDVLVSVHVVRQVTRQIPEQPDLSPQLQLHLGRKKLNCSNIVEEKQESG